MPIQTRAQQLALSETPTARPTTAAAASVADSGDSQRSRRVPQPTEFFAVEIPQRKPMRRQREPDREASASGSSSSSDSDIVLLTNSGRRGNNKSASRKPANKSKKARRASGGGDGGASPRGVALPMRAARVEFEERVKRGHLDSSSSSASSSEEEEDSDDDDNAADSDASGDGDESRDGEDARASNSRGKKTKNGGRDSAKRTSSSRKDAGARRNSATNNNRGGGRGASAVRDRVKALKSRLGQDKKRSESRRRNQANNRRNADSDRSSDASDASDAASSSSSASSASARDGSVTGYDSDEGDEGGVIDHPDPREIERALSARVTLNSKLESLLEAHRAKLAHLKLRAGDDDGGHNNHNNDKSASRAHPQKADGGGGDGGASGRLRAPKCVDVASLDPVTFTEVGGVQEHVVSLREMMLLPLTYPHLFARLNIKPPRGVLFVGPPGNGKTLMARALAQECSRLSAASASAGGGGRPVSFFARKGADIMCKWVGEGERNLSELFAEAKRMQPSIIFFDEIDGLAPVRHMKQESSHASVVSTLLALMDGLDDRGQIVVIGATNRPDTLDPALRRPGRFDRELRFDYPEPAGRLQILRIHTRTWDIGASAGDLARIVGETHGYSGADLQALCTEASLVALRRFCPHMFLSSQRFDVDASNVRVTVEDFMVAARRMTPSSHRARNVSNMNDTPLRRCLAQSTTVDVIDALRSHWHGDRAGDGARVSADAASASQGVRNHLPGNSADRGRSRSSHHVNDDEAAAAASDAVTSFLESVRPPRVASMCQSSAIVVVTVEHASPRTSSVEAAAACSIDELGRAFAGALVVSYCFASCSVGGVDPSCLAEQRSGDAAETGRAGVAALLSYTLRHDKVVVVLTGVESLPEEVDEADAEADAPLRWLFDAMAHRDTAVLVPASAAAIKTHAKRMRSMFGAVLYDRVVFEVSAGVRVADLDNALDKIVVPDLCASLLLRMPEAPPLYDASRDAAAAAADNININNNNNNSADAVARRVAQNDNWERIQYKRAQLRQTLRELYISLLSKAKFDIFMHADLDLGKFEQGKDAAARRTLQQWRKQHAKTASPMTLGVIGDKIDDDAYNGISQFNADVDELVAKVFRFFGMDKASRKYRDRARQLKEQVLMANLKLNRSLALFCEDNIEAVEPRFNNNNNNIATTAKSSSGRTRAPAAADTTPPHAGRSKTATPQTAASSASGSASSATTAAGRRASAASAAASAAKSASASASRRLGKDAAVESSSADDEDEDESGSGSGSDDDDSSSSASSNEDSAAASSSAASPHSLRLATRLPEAIVAELRAAMRAVFKLPAKAAPADAAGQSLNRCEQLLCVELMQRSERVRKVRAQIEALAAKAAASAAAASASKRGAAAAIVGRSPASAASSAASASPAARVVRVTARPDPDVTPARGRAAAASKGRR